MAGRDIFTALEVPDYRWLWMGSLASQFAMNMQIVARGWLVYALTSSALDLAWVTLSFMLPQALFSLWGGVVADRMPKRRIIATAQATNCILTIVMAAVIFTGRVEMWHFLVMGVLNGTILALSMPARQAFIPELIPERLIFTGMALNTTSWNLSRILGPAVAGLLIAWLAAGDTSSVFGVGVVYCVIALLYGVAALTVMRVSQPGRMKAPDGKTPLHDVVDGLRYVRAHPPVLALILLSIVPFLFGMPLNTLLPAFNEEVLGGGPDDLGFLISCMGLGAILGSLMLASMGELRNKGRWLLASCTAWGVFTIAFGSAERVVTAAVLVGLVGLVSAWNMSLNRGLLQMQVDSTMRGRIMSIDMMSHGLMPLGVIPIGYLADRFSVAVALEAAGAVFVLSVVLLACFNRSIRHMDRVLATPTRAQSLANQTE
ncbi:MAG: MFS transporter [Pseudomonadales bacterium]|nr:MFS transporter [Pseudomonadales bacterium]